MFEQYEYYEKISDHIDKVIDFINSIPENKIYDINYIENFIIHEIGLNNEYLEQQPPELGDYFGKGLHLWQYPRQLARYMVWLSYNAQNMTSYCEIGCRWGGTFIVVNEWLKKIGAPIEFSLAIDPVPATPFIKRYMEISDTPVHYIQNLSTSRDVIDYLTCAKPSMVFIDGDHSMNGVMFDHLLVRKFADIIVHHDVASDACPATTLFWSYVKQAEDGFEASEFTQQYDSVPGNFLGIGVLKRL
ncbi:class I SAM-dependent methyltransferase [Allorhizobium sp. BGMRC 0089]|uniref:class I SAM-dependent methyltransferase n=1 Tax=Allorhizobium sonneratiae TaxID=2934936 RepID=UPI0020334969|nr:class I SAM-dependent methyltransferase [Allorhizobium sonneratiae]MCM2290913.1 class I SAM-dependent methyltransferase [Allorhizobium sonneratiae]